MYITYLCILFGSRLGRGFEEWGYCLPEFKQVRGKRNDLIAGRLEHVEAAHL
jgi:hypothetical protein